MCVGNGTLRLDRHNCTHVNLDFLSNWLYGDILYGFMFTVYTVNNIYIVTCTLLFKKHHTVEVCEKFPQVERRLHTVSPRERSLIR